jgi:V/A-type H+-transporting ATPase subunit I
MIRPHPAEWFEILVAKDDSVLLLEALARNACVELEAGAGARREPPEELQRLLRRFEGLSESFAAYWPRPDTVARPVEIGQMVAASVSAIETWAAAAASAVESLRALESERADLVLWQQVLAQIRNSAIDLARTIAPGGGLECALFVFSPETAVTVSAELLGLPIALGEESGVLAVGSKEALAAFAQTAVSAQGKRFAIPNWLRGSAGESLELANQRLAAVEASLTAVRGELERASAACRLGEALGGLRHAQWMMRSMHVVASGENFCRITGWTDDRGRLTATLDASGARALVHSPQPPGGIDAPLLLHNPWWAQPFEVFSRALGMPARYAADPSVFLAVIVPLLFGYMFGDVGQGAVLIAAGLLLRKRVPILGMLIAGGVSAILFGLLFGSVFGLHGIVPALWLEPLEAPLPVLVVPLTGGAVLLLLGLFINALEAYWRGKSRHWLVTDAGLIVVYAGVVGGFFDQSGYWIAGLGALLPVIGHLALTRRLRPTLAAIGTLLERTLQLLINTLSFVRVGAFALAHAGLSAAVVALAEATTSATGHAVVMVVGNIVAIAIEATIVSVQTTRLVLFEFFTRFFVSKGREFRPLTPPVFVSGELRESTS